MVMRKIHSTQMATLVRQRVSRLTPTFREASAADARVFGTQRRLSFVATYGNGRAYLLFEPSGTARDNYFTLDIAWISRSVAIDDLPDIVYFIPEGLTVEDMAKQSSVRLRAACLWPGAPESKDVAFKFSTASSRYNQRLFDIARTTPIVPDEVAYQMFKAFMDEEAALAPASAMAEVLPAVDFCMSQILAFVLPFFSAADIQARQRYE